MGWNYRVCKKTNCYVTNNVEQSYVTYAIHEAYYNASGEIWAITENPKCIITDLCEFSCTDENECLTSMQTMLEMMQLAFTKPIVDLDTIVYADN